MILNLLKKTNAYTLGTGIILTSAFSLFEPEYARAQSVTDNVVVTLTVTGGISISSPTDVTMAPNISISADGSIGSATWNVKTNDPDGYTLAVKASTTPALKQSTGQSFADYTPGTPGTPDIWNVPVGGLEFGFSAFGANVTTATWGTGSSCGAAGIPTGTQKYDAFTTSNRTIATGTATTTAAGVDTTVCFAAEQDAVYAPAGIYTADITATATVQ